MSLGNYYHSFGRIAQELAALPTEKERKAMIRLLEQGGLPELFQRCEPPLQRAAIQLLGTTPAKQASSLRKYPPEDQIPILLLSLFFARRAANEGRTAELYLTLQGMEYRKALQLVTEQRLLNREPPIAHDLADLLESVSSWR